MATRNRGIGWLLGKPWFWAACVGTLFGLPLIRSLLRPTPVAPGIRSTVAPFSLIRQTGEPYGLDALRGKVWVVSRLGADDAPQMKAMHELERHMRNLAEAFMLVSIADDPGQQTPATLQAWATQHKSNPRRWTLLTGAPDEVSRVRASLEIEPGHAVPYPLTLVDAHGRIRAVYDAGGIPADVHEMLEQLQYDAALVVHEY